MIRFCLFGFVVLLALASFSSVEAQTECRPGEQTKQDCNNCFCVPPGLWSCTKMKCLRKRAAYPTPCQEGETASFDNGCNTCTCTNNLWACTQKFCLNLNP